MYGGRLFRGEPSCPYWIHMKFGEGSLRNQWKDVVCWLATVHGSMINVSERNYLLEVVADFFCFGILGPFIRALWQFVEQIPWAWTWPVRLFVTFQCWKWLWSKMDRFASWLTDWFWRWNLAVLYAELSSWEVPDKSLSFRIGLGRQSKLSWLTTRV